MPQETPIQRILALLLALCLTPAHADLVPEGAEVEKVADGYRFTEGPALGPDGCIYFTDIPAATINRFDPETGQTTVFREDTGNANGLMWFNGDLYMCCHGTRAVRLYPIHPNHQEVGEPDIFGNTPETVDPEDPMTLIHRLPTDETIGGSDGRRDIELTVHVAFNSPNDLAIDEAGNIYYTDPRYGNRDNMETDVEGVYFSGSIDIDDPFYEQNVAVTCLDERLVRPNGIVLSPDESILYVADHGANWIYAYDIAEPGVVENKRQFAQLNGGEGRGSDGMCVDQRGRLYATGHGRVWAFEPTGELVATIAVGPATTNCTFAGDGRTLYITADHGLFRIELNTAAPLTGEADD